MKRILSRIRFGLCCVCHHLFHQPWSVPAIFMAIGVMFTLLVIFLVL